jgi:hypothetical protein
MSDQVPYIVPPGFEPVQRHTISFFATVSASGNSTLVSQRISVPFVVHQVRASFALNTARTLKLRFFLSLDKSAPSALPLTGSNILADIGQVDYLVGDDDTKVLNTSFLSASGGAFVKVFAENTDVNDHTVDVQIDVLLLRKVVP